MDKKNEVSVLQKTLTVEEVKAGIQTIQKVLKGTMIEDVHYGVIPGTKNKSLLKPGAEKIMATFRIAPSFEIINLSKEDEVRYQIITSGSYSPTGLFLGQGIGECSTSEEKFKWRKSLGDEEFDHFPEDRRRTKWKSKGYGKPPFPEKQVRTDPADKANTVLKMAKKRSCIDMVLTVTAASDIFTQDIDEDSSFSNVKEDLKKEKPKPTGEFKCDECKKDIPENIFSFSTKTYGRGLCFEHQKKYKND